MAANTVSVEVKLIDSISTKLDAITKKIESTSKKTKQSTDAMSASANSMRTAYIGLAGFVGGAFAASFVKAATEMEKLETQFSTLLSSTTAAKNRMQELATFAAKTPFELPEVAKSSRVLEVLTQGALSTGDGLRMVGDAAASSGAQFDDVAMWIGRLYDGLQSGRPFGEASMRLQELGLMSGATRSQLEKVTEGTLSSAEGWRIFSEQMDRFSGGMASLNNTVGGQWSNLMDSMKASQRDFMSSAMVPMKNALSSMSEALGELNDSGAFKALGANMNMIAAAAIAVAGARWGIMASQINLATLATTRLKIAMDLLAKNPVILAATAAGLLINVAINSESDRLDKKTAANEAYASGAALKDPAKRNRAEELLNQIEAENERTKGMTRRVNNKFVGQFEKEIGFSPAVAGNGDLNRGINMLRVEIKNLDNGIKSSTGTIASDAASKMSTALGGGKGEEKGKSITVGMRESTLIDRLKMEERIAAKEDAERQEKADKERAKATRSQQGQIGIANAQTGLANADTPEAKIEAERALVAAQWDARLAAEEQGSAMLAALKAQKNAELNQLDRNSAAERVRIAEVETRSRMQAASTLMSGLSQLLATGAAKNRKLAAAAKTLATGEAIVNTFLAANKALGQLGPIAGTIAAGGMIAAGMANVIKIQSTKYEQGGYISGARHSGGGVPIEAEGGEYMLSRSDVNRLGGAQNIDRLRKTGGGQSISLNAPINIVMNSTATADDVGLAVEDALHREAEKLIRITRYAQSNGMGRGVLV